MIGYTYFQHYVHILLHLFVPLEKNKVSHQANAVQNIAPFGISNHIHTATCVVKKNTKQNNRTKMNQSVRVLHKEMIRFHMLAVTTEQSVLS